MLVFSRTRRSLRVPRAWLGARRRSRAAHPVVRTLRGGAATARGTFGAHSGRGNRQDLRTLRLGPGISDPGRTGAPVDVGVRSLSHRPDVVQVAGTVEPVTPSEILASL